MSTCRAVSELHESWLSIAQVAPTRMQHSCMLNQQLQAFTVRQRVGNRRRKPRTSRQGVCLLTTEDATGFVSTTNDQKAEDDSFSGVEGRSKADARLASTSTDRRGLIRGAISATPASSAPTILPEVLNTPAADAVPLAFQGPPVARGRLSADIPPGIAAVRDPALYRLTCRMAVGCS